MSWLIRIFFIVVAVIVLTVGALLLLPGEKLARLAADQIGAQTGRDVTLSGEVDLSFWPVLGFQTGPVQFGNADWAGPEPMLSAGSLAVAISTSDLLQGKVQVQKIIARDPVLRLIRQGERANWDFTAPATHEPDTSELSAQQDTPTDGTRTVSATGLDLLELEQARLVVVQDGAVQLDRSGVDLSLRWPRISGPLDLDMVLQPGPEPLRIAARVADPLALTDGGLSALDLDVSTRPGSIAFEGRFSSAGDVAGAVSITAQEIGGLLAALGAADVSVPDMFGPNATLRAQATYTSDGRLSLRQLDLALGKNRVTGDADILTTPKPRVTAHLTAGALDFNDTASTPGGAAGGADAPPSSAQGWSRAPIDASALGLLDANIAVSATSIETPVAKLGQSNLSLNIDRSRAVLRMEPVHVFSGQVRGQLVANNRNGLSVGGKLTASDINLKTALNSLVGMDRFSGTANGALEFLGVGQSQDQIMRSLSGKGSVGIGQGHIAGLDLDALMDGAARDGGTTVFNSLTASFTLQGGNLINRDLLMQLDNYRADGEGRIGLGARDLDYLFTPTALRANSGKGVSIPVRIVGPWSDPSVRPDLEKALKAAAEVELDKIEDKAKQELQRKLSEELDTPVTEDQDIEDLIKDRLEDEAKKGLLKLFGVD